MGRSRRPSTGFVDRHRTVDEPGDGGTVICLVHEGLTGEQAAGNARGWSPYLERLAIAAGNLSVELLVHALDLARATSQPVAASDALAEYVLAPAREVITPQMRDGDRFGPEVEMRPELDRMAAFTRRTP